MAYRYSACYRFTITIYRAPTFGTLRFLTLYGEPEIATIGSTHNHPANLAIEPATPVLPWAVRFSNH